MNTAIVLKHNETNTDVIARELAFKAVDKTGRSASFVASTDTVDAHGEIVDQSTWKLDDYLSNPVVLYSHMSRDLPIGKCVDIAVRGGQLECKIEFATEEMNPLAEQVWKMVQAKVLRAVSVGFIPQTARYEMRDGNEVLVWSDCILKEISVTPVPANPQALAKMKSAAPHVRWGSPPAPPKVESDYERTMKELRESHANAETIQPGGRPFDEARADFEARSVAAVLENRRKAGLPMTTPTREPTSLERHERFAAKSRGGDDLANLIFGDKP